MQTTLYKKDSKGKTREWNIAVEDLGTEAKITVTAGLLGGNLVPATTFVTKGKNEGKANATTYWTQAVADAQAKINSQLRDGYVADLANLIDSALKGSGAISVMTAKTYDPTEGKKKGLKEHKLIGKTIGKQRKFDGVRRITHVTASAATMYTRGGDVSTTLPHIEKQLVSRFNEIKDELGLEEIWLDGEAYSHDLSFNKINGITRKGAESLDDIADSLMIDYILYDAVTDDNYLEREILFKRFVNTNIKAVETEWIVADEKDLEETMIKFIEEGYEGLMIRVNGFPYQPNKRSSSLLKYKVFEDAEFECVNIYEGKYRGMAAKLEVKVDRPCFDSDGKAIETFFPTLVGKHPELRWALQNPDHFIGKKVTVNFMGRSEGGIPRHCRVKDVRYDI